MKKEKKNPLPISFDKSLLILYYNVRHAKIMGKKKHSSKADVSETSGIQVYVYKCAADTQHANAFGGTPYTIPCQ